MKTKDKWPPAEPDAMPIDVAVNGLGTGELPNVRVTYDCKSQEAAMRTIDKAIAIHGACDADWNPKTSELVLVFR